MNVQMHYCYSELLNKILCPYCVVCEVCIVPEMLAHIQALWVTKK